jgi:hypothetical protein
MKLRKRDKKILGGVFGLAYVSGVVLFALNRWLRIPSDIGEQHHPSEQWVRISHAVFAYAVVTALGYMIKAHVLPGLKAGKRLKSGIGMLLVFGVLIVTALGILYSGESDWSGIMIQSHDWVGFLAPALILFHSWKRLTDSKYLNSKVKNS